eukprot:1671014-Pyramimonas_sp.AAC.1
MLWMLGAYSSCRTGTGRGRAAKRRYGRFVRDVRGYGVDVRHFVRDVRGYVVDVRGYGVDVRHFVRDVRGYGVDVRHFVWDVRGYVVDVTHPCLQCAAAVGPRLAEFPPGNMGGEAR